LKKKNSNNKTKNTKSDMLLEKSICEVWIKIINYSTILNTWIEEK